MGLHLGAWQLLPTRRAVLEVDEVRRLGTGLRHAQEQPHAHGLALGLVVHLGERP